MSRNSKGHGSNKRFKAKPAVGDKAREFLENIDENNPVMKMFLQYRQELDEKHDRYEKIVKLSRDITIENKRIIFLLHSVNTDIENKKQQVLTEAETRLKQIVQTGFKPIALLLQDFDPYQYHKAYTSGLQEFIEALVFYQFLKDENSFESWARINQDYFQFSLENGDDAQQPEAESASTAPVIELLFPQLDYILGIADFTGEMMRRCINNLGIGNVNECFKICNLVKDIHTGFSGIVSPGSREFGRKAYVLKQSLAKMELVCYNIHVRGSEIPKHMLVNVLESNEISEEVDEGYF